ncbi:MAG: 5-(carboxyamino)imidazole ribonucleotide synthase [Chloracidobacterium sp.]|nr:5-(carboxyamino)imidazole ribonucleotide synthase [Chloracidobacterium sp.]MDW8217708.1 5-(carboxyamino)imidazole ribonucleotide synthase [Acidobacteriota bacterium]
MTQRIAILGGGQLARMSAYAAYRLGCEVGIVARPGDDSPALLTATERFIGDWSSLELLDTVAAYADAVLLENEFIAPDILRYLEATGKPRVAPSSHTIALVQDKFAQKTALAQAGLPVPRFAATDSPDEVLEVSRRFGLPLVLKCRTNGYDGYGNELIRSAADIAPAFEKLRKRGSSLMAEEFVPFTKELAVMAVRNRRGEEVIYPVVETIQHAHVCHTVLAPAAISEATAASVTALARRVLEAIAGVGIFGIELFLLNDGEVLINEIAPRPHNSGHYTIEACETSQFENHVRAGLDLPLGSPRMRSPVAVMVNLLGGFDAPARPIGLETALQVPGVTVHLYGKKASRPGRKMGHVTALGDDLAETRERALRAARAITI